MALGALQALLYRQVMQGMPELLVVQRLLDRINTPMGVEEVWVARFPPRLFMAVLAVALVVLEV